VTHSDTFRQAGKGVGGLCRGLLPPLVAQKANCKLFCLLGFLIWLTPFVESKVNEDYLYYLQLQNKYEDIKE